MLSCSSVNHTRDLGDVVTDNFFTSHGLVVALLKVNLTLLGTIRCNRKEIPIELRNKKRQRESSEFALDHENHIMLASHIPQKNKNVIVLSSSHSGLQTFPEKANKPKLILDYNCGKKGVDKFDENVQMFTCRRRTVRWPLLIFFNALDVAAFCAYLLFKKDGRKVSRKVFLKNLSKQLAHSSAVVRHTTNTRLPRATRGCACIWLLAGSCSTWSSTSLSWKVQGVLKGFMLEM